jgi:hypothetical protein
MANEVQTRKKKKPPKPGSKQAKELKQRDIVFEMPDVFTAESTIIFKFSSSSAMKAAFERPHCYYEKQELRGPLKGVNFPISIYNEWKISTDLTECEKAIAQVIEAIGPEYLVSCLKKDASTFLHEWAHVVYHFNMDYREEVKAKWMELSGETKIGIEKELSMRNYAPQVYLDEFQAYVRESPGDFGKKFTKELQPIHEFFKRRVMIPNQEPYSQDMPPT